jgi:hypothetical protein
MKMIVSRRDEQKAKAEDELSAPSCINEDDKRKGARMRQVEGG